jgi:hypothetical protein
VCTSQGVLKKMTGWMTCPWGTVSHKKKTCKAWRDGIRKSILKKAKEKATTPGNQTKPLAEKPWRNLSGRNGHKKEAKTKP